MDTPTERALERAIAGALRSAIRDHGPITAAWIGSATKRVLGNLANAPLTAADAIAVFGCRSEGAQGTGSRSNRQ